MQQQVLAAQAGMGSAALCSMEKGRRAVPSDERVEVLARALGLSHGQQASLLQRAAHDRLIGYLQRQGLDQAIPLISQALQLSWLCTERQAASVCADLGRHAQALSRVASLDRELVATEEAAM